MRYAELFRLTPVNLGYALFLAISAASIWGGVFPYLPQVVQTAESTMAFYTAQLLSICIALAAVFDVSRHSDQQNLGDHAIGFAVPYSVGALMLIVAMYVDALAIPLIVFGAILVGIGSAGYMVGWQSVIAGEDVDAGNVALTTGTAYSALIYFALCLIPTALTSYLIPLMLVPLDALCLWIASRDTDMDQPMFQDVPVEHWSVYANALKENLVPAITVGALGFCAGSVRFISITHQELVSDINIGSMSALLLVVLVFLAVRRQRTIKLDILAVYRLLLPVAATCLVVLPFAGQSFTVVGASLCYACFMLAIMLMMMHCGQLSRESGVSPVLVYSFFVMVAYFPQVIGYLVGYASGIESQLGVEQFSLVSLLALYVIVWALLPMRSDRLHTNRLELLMLSRDRRDRAASKTDLSNEVAIAKSLEERSRHAGPQKRGYVYEAPIHDKLSKQCQTASKKFGLSARESEVMELIVRGNTATAISDRLFISENTVRTHIRRIYSKLGIHKKQELLELIDHQPLD